MEQRRVLGARSRDKRVNETLRRTLLVFYLYFIHDCDWRDDFLAVKLLRYSRVAVLNRCRRRVVTYRTRTPWQCLPMSQVCQAPETGDNDDKKGIRSQSGIGLDLEESKGENERLGRTGEEVASLWIEASCSFPRGACCAYSGVSEARRNSFHSRRTEAQSGKCAGCVHRKFPNFRHKTWSSDSVNATHKSLSLVAPYF